MMVKTVCIISEKETNGVPIKEDFVIKTIRKIKNVFGIAKGYNLVVSEASWEEYSKKRKSFEKKLLMWGILAVIILVIFAIMFLLTGSLSILDVIKTLIMFALLFGVMIALVFVASYIPKTTMSLEEWKSKGKRSKVVKKTTKKKTKKVTKKKTKKSKKR